MEENQVNVGLTQLSSSSDDDCCHVVDSLACTLATQASNKKMKNYFVVWNYFHRYVDAKRKERAQCKTCPKHYAAEASDGISNLAKHHDKCKRLAFHDIKQMTLDQAAKLRAQKVDQMVFREKLALSVLLHNYAFSFCEHVGTRDLYNYLNEDVVPISRNTCKADILKINKREKLNVKTLLSKVPGRICLTSDMWSSSTSDGYICLTAHFVDENWKLQSRILNFCHMAPPHNGVTLSDKVFEFLKEWEIEKQIFSITLDNASSNDQMQDHLRAQLNLHGSLVLSGEYFHVRCSAHVLNLIVQDGLKLIGGALHKIRESVKYVKGSRSQVRKIRFRDCAEKVGVSTAKGLRMDVSTRWNFTYFMLERALIYRRAFEHLKLVDDGYKTCPSSEEWMRGEVICNFLKPFADITTLISGSQYPTANLYFQCVWRIQMSLIEEMKSQDKVISDMATNMKKKFDKYWDCYSVVLAFAIVLDPRRKLNYVDYCFKKIDELTYKSKVNLVRSELCALYEEYARKSSNNDKEKASKISCSGGGPSGGGAHYLEDDDEEFMSYESSYCDTTKKSDLDIYLEESRLPLQDFKDMDVLEYWKGNERTRPILAKMARDILSIPITSVASESAFSIGSRVLNKYRGSLLPENAEILITTRNWMYGYEVSEDFCLGDLEVNFSNLDIQSSCDQSRVASTSFVN